MTYILTKVDWTSEHISPDHGQIIAMHGQFYNSLARDLSVIEAMLFYVLKPNVKSEIFTKLNTSKFRIAILLVKQHVWISSIDEMRV